MYLYVCVCMEGLLPTIQAAFVGSTTRRGPGHHRAEHLESRLRRCRPLRDGEASHKDCILGSTTRAAEG